jgi:hypothetical protein
MNSWTPIVHSIASVSIPGVVEPYTITTEQQWLEAQDRWRGSGRADYSMWGVYEDLTHRLLLPTSKSWTLGRLGEFYVAWLLEREGFTCWGGVHFFDGGKPIRGGKRVGRADTGRNTRHVRALWPDGRWRWPGEVQHTLDDMVAPRNPDLVDITRDGVSGASAK